MFRMARNLPLLLCLIFGPMGVVFLAVGCITAYITLDFKGKAIPAEGVVVNLIESRGDHGTPLYAPAVEWTDSEGKKRHFVGSTASSPPSYSRGDRVKVIYDPANPEHARIDSFVESWLLPLVFSGIGSVFTAVGAAFGLYLLRKRKNRKWLKAHGTAVQAKFTGAPINSFIQVRGLNFTQGPWILTAQWQDPKTGLVYTFKSDPIWFDPSPFMTADSLQVLVNPDKPKVYYIDTGFLPKHA